MTDEEKRIFFQNIEWVRGQNKSNETILSGVLSDAAKIVIDRYKAIPPAREIIRIYNEISGEELSDYSCCEFAQFCLELFSNENNLSEKKEIKSKEYETDILKTVSYIKNEYSECAFNAFSKRLGSLNARYDADFQTMCESVYYGKSKYCIIPVESSADGFLISFRKMIDKYDLKIILAYNAVTRDDNLITFALCSANNNNAEKNFWEISIFFEDICKVSDFLTSAKLFGAYVKRINSLPFSHSNGYYVFHICFDIKSAKIYAFEYFLKARFPQYSSYGRYSFIDENGNEL